MFAFSKPENVWWSETQPSFNPCDEKKNILLPRWVLWHQQYRMFKLQVGLGCENIQITVCPTIMEVKNGSRQ